MLINRVPMRALLTFLIDTATMLLRKRSHRLEAQDAALSRPKPGFESPWEHLATKKPIQILRDGLLLLCKAFYTRSTTLHRQGTGWAHCFCFVSMRLIVRIASPAVT